MNSEHDVKEIRLTSSEISQLWISYMANTMSNCMLAYFSKTSDDPDVVSIAEHGLELSKNYVSFIKDILSKESYPVPEGFTEKDVNINAKKLFSDTFVLRYMKYLTELGLLNYGMSLTFCPRIDVREFFTYAIDTTAKLSNSLDDLLLEKGLYLHSPYIPVPNTIEFVHRKSFLNGFLPDKRPLNASEIANIFHDIRVISLARALKLAFSQVVESNEVKSFFLKGLKLSKDHIERLSPLLKESDLPVPMTLEAEVLDSTESPFSDKLMTYHISTLMGYKTVIYGISMASSMRTDIYSTYAHLIVDVSTYTKDGMDIMINNGWLEKNPEAANRKELAKL